MNHEIQHTPNKSRKNPRESISTDNLKKVVKIGVMGLLMSQTADAAPPSAEEELKRSLQRNTELMQNTIKLQQKIEETNAELGALLEGFEKNMPAGIPGKPEVFMGTDGHITPEAKAWIMETLPKEHTKLLEDLKKAEKDMDKVPVGSHAWWNHWQTYALAVYALVATIGMVGLGILAIPPVGTGMGHGIVLAAVHGGSKWLGRRRPKNGGEGPPSLPPSPPVV